MQKMCGFRNIQIRVDEALMFNASLYIYNPTCYEFKIHFRSSSLSLVFFSLSPFSLVSGFSVFLVVVFFVMVFGTLISGLLCILANNWAKFLCPQGGR